LLQGRFGATLSFHLVQIGAISEQNLLVFFLYHFPVEYYASDKLDSIPPSVVSSLSADVAGHLRVLPIERTDTKLLLGMTDPSRTHVLEEVAFHTNCFVKPALVSEADMSRALEHYYGVRTASGSTGEESATVRPDDARIVDLNRLDRPSWPEVDHEVLGKSSIPLPSLSSRPSMPAPVGSYARLASEASRASYLPVEIKGSFVQDEPREELRKARHRDDVVRSALELLSVVGERTAFFVLLRSEIRGFAIRGLGTATSSIKSFWIPSSARSTLADALTEQAVHLGPLGRTPADGVLAAALGGRPERVLVVPVAIRSRAVGLLYADHLKQDMPELRSLAHFGDEVGNALGRFLPAK
jgi:hypothetical protein